MTAAQELQSAETVENFASPAVVYFWGPVRDHVNRVAAEYASRFRTEPVWVNVRADRSDATHPTDSIPLTGPHVFELSAGAVAGFVSTAQAPRALEGSSESPALEGSAPSRVVLRFPATGPVALREAPEGDPDGAFVLSNIDRMEDAASLLEPRAGPSLVGACRERGVVLVLTSEGLLPMPPTESECAVEVVSMPEEEWWEAEVRPGVPFNSGAGRPGPDAEGYALGFPELRPDDPLLAKSSGPAAHETAPQDLYPASFGRGAELDLSELN